MLRAAITWPVGLSLSVLGAHASAEWGVNMRRGVTEVSQSVFDLHMTIFWICVVIGILVFGVMFWSMLMHRKSEDSKPATFHEHLGVEILWTVIPLAILIVMAIPATKTLIDIYDAAAVADMQSSLENGMPIKLVYDAPSGGAHTMYQTHVERGEVI